MIKFNAAIPMHGLKRNSAPKEDQILEVIGEQISETNFDELRKMKKAELVAAAERRLAQNRRLAEILRS